MEALFVVNMGMKELTMGLQLCFIFLGDNSGSFVFL